MCWTLVESRLVVPLYSDIAAGCILVATSACDQGVPALRDTIETRFLDDASAPEYLIRGSSFVNSGRPTHCGCKRSPRVRLSCVQMASFVVSAVVVLSVFVAWCSVFVLVS